VIEFEWDEAKARVNLAKHGISFEEATSVFNDPLTITITDPLHSSPGEERWVTMGPSYRRRLLAVVHSEEADTIRVISAREVTRRERKAYEEN
jgi:uncharacterized protein